MVAKAKALQINVETSFCASIAILFEIITFSIQKALIPVTVTVENY